MIDVGDTYQAAFTVTDDTGAPADATSVTLTVTLPDGTTVSPAVTNPPAQTGQYTTDYVTAQPGRHVFTWLATGPAAAYADVIDVAAPTDAIISLAQAKTRLRITSTDRDDELRDWIASITATIERIKHETITRRTVTETTQGKGRTFRLWAPPVIDLVSVASEDGTQTWDPAAMKVSSGSGLVRVLTGPYVHGRLEVEYTAGYEVVPANYVQAALVILQNLWQTERGVMGVKMGGEEEKPTLRWAGEYWGLVPRRAQELLGISDPVVA